MCKMLCVQWCDTQVSLAPVPAHRKIVLIRHLLRQPHAQLPVRILRVVSWRSALYSVRLIIELAHPPPPKE